MASPRGCGGRAIGGRAIRSTNDTSRAASVCSVSLVTVAPVAGNGGSRSRLRLDTSRRARTYHRGGGRYVSEGETEPRPAWIRLIAPAEAEGRLRATYDRVADADGRIDRVLQLHGLRPHTLDAHLALYKATLHHAGNRLPRWLLELAGTVVSRLNGCDYCVAHHLAGLGRLVGDDRSAALLDATERGADALREAVDGEADTLPGATGAGAAAAIHYARALTLEPARMERADVDALRAAGFDDGEVLEINQVVAYFAYVNRAVLGLGVSHEGERLGLAPTNTGEESDVRHR
ncbi:MAG: peroxidase-related enzyme [Trueperaceae bacterium]|nr:peroxidase-related enzyme [Trueperaceae bacterium]